MRLLSGFSLFAFLMIIAFPVNADAFSRRSSHSEVAPQTVPLKATQTNTSQTNTLDVSPQAVPEPPVVLLMGLGFGLLALGTMVMRYRRTDRSSPS